MVSPMPGIGEHNPSRVQSARDSVQKSKGDLYPVWVLNQSHTEIMLANRVAMGRGLTSDRFKWVPFVDMFLFPLNNALLKAKDPDKKLFFTREEQLLRRLSARCAVKVSFREASTTT